MKRRNGPKVRQFLSRLVLFLLILYIVIMLPIYLFFQYYAPEEWNFCIVLIPPLLHLY
jgi:hypothetical protein